MYPLVIPLYTLERVISLINRAFGPNGLPDWLNFLPLTLLIWLGLFFIEGVIYYFWKRRKEPFPHKNITLIISSILQVILLISFFSGTGSQRVFQYNTGLNLLIGISYFILIGSGLVALLFFFLRFCIWLIDTIFKKTLVWQKWSVYITTGIVVYGVLAVSLGLLELFASPIPNPSASRFAIINAAIKNTCFIDPAKANCPQSLEEISYIEPQAYKSMIENNQVQYVYHPESNLYTLVVRYSPTRAVIFDWRLTDTTTIDFKDTEVSVLGKDRIKNPPDWDGPWTFPEWKYGF